LVVDPKKADQQIRGAVCSFQTDRLKTQKVLVFGLKADKAKKQKQLEQEDYVGEAE